MKTLAVGDTVSFSYLKGVDRQGHKPALVDYSAKAQNYEGTVEEIRDITKSPLSNHTVNYGTIKGERSRNLVTISIDGDGSKAFYDGRMVNTQKVKS